MGYKEVEKIEFNQSGYLMGKEGICDTLVLGWLESDGGHPSASAIVFANVAHNKKLQFSQLLTAGGYNLVMSSMEETTNANEVVSTAMRPFSKVLIRLGGPKIGHAVGVMTSMPGSYRFFDPNEGICVIEDDASGTWLADRLLVAKFSEGYNEYITVSFY